MVAEEDLAVLVVGALGTYVSILCLKTERALREQIEDGSSKCAGMRICICCWMEAFVVGGRLDVVVVAADTGRLPDFCM